MYKRRMFYDLKPLLTKQKPAFVLVSLTLTDWFVTYRRNILLALAETENMKMKKWDS